MMHENYECLKILTFICHTHTLDCHTFCRNTHPHFPYLVTVSVINIDFLKFQVSLIILRYLDLITNESR